MGTRNLTCVYLNGEYKVAQYGQWDGGPNWSGMNVLKFLTKLTAKGPKGIAAFAAKVAKCYWADVKESEALWEEFDAAKKVIQKEKEAKDQYVTAPDTVHLRGVQTTRDTGALILTVIDKQVKARDKKGLGLSNHIEFARDSLFCEWAYVVDLDKQTLEVYKGFNTSALCKVDRFSFLNKKVQPNERDKEPHYYPVRMVRSYDLANLPTKEQFLEELTVVTKYPGED